MSYLERLLNSRGKDSAIYKAMSDHRNWQERMTDAAKKLKADMEKAMRSKDNIRFYD